MKLFKKFLVGLVIFILLLIAKYYVKKSLQAWQPTHVVVIVNSDFRWMKKQNGKISWKNKPDPTDQVFILNTQLPKKLIKDIPDMPFKSFIEKNL